MIPAFPGIVCQVTEGLHHSPPEQWRASQWGSDHFQNFQEFIKADRDPIFRDRGDFVPDPRKNSTNGRI
jgi:hypothetical protein